MSSTVQIVIPGLFDLPLQELETDFLHELTNLNRFLRLSTPRCNQTYSIDAIVLRALGWEVSSVAGLPIAQAYAEPGAQDCNRYLLFQAIHLKPDLHSAVILPVENNTTEIDLLINDLIDMFKVDCDIKVIAPGVYLLRLLDFDAPLHYPHILSVLGKSANPYIEQSREVLPWYKLLNEMQMFLHQHETNRHRQNAGLLPVNSFWFWGAGCLPEKNEFDLNWFCDDQLLNRFAQSLGLRPRPIQQMSLGTVTGDSLVIELGLIQALKLGRGVSLRELLSEIDRRIFKPILDSLGGGHSRIVLSAGFRNDFAMQPLSRFKFWKPQRSLIDWQAQADDG